jgi:hypothetical protein
MNPGAMKGRNGGCAVVGHSGRKKGILPGSLHDLELVAFPYVNLLEGYHDIDSCSLVFFSRWLQDDLNLTCLVVWNIFYFP